MFNGLVIKKINDKTVLIRIKYKNNIYSVIKAFIKNLILNRFNRLNKGF